MSSIKRISEAFANAYIHMIQSQIIIEEMGHLAPPAAINVPNRMRAELVLLEEEISFRYKTLRKLGYTDFESLDPDADCRG